MKKEYTILFENSGFYYFMTHSFKSNGDWYKIKKNIPGEIEHLNWEMIRKNRDANTLYWFSLDEATRLMNKWIKEKKDLRSTNRDKYISGVYFKPFLMKRTKFEKFRKKALIQMEELRNGK